MFGRSATRQTAAQAGREAVDRQPLLPSAENEEHSKTLLFEANDFEEEEDSALGRSSEDRGERHTRKITSEPPMIAPSLRSTIQSREAEFDLDTDELDENAISQLRAASAMSPRPGRSRRGRSDTDADHSMPLLVGLLDSAALRTPGSSSMRMEPNGHGDGEDVDLEELAQRRLKGGGMIDSIANMANSILGAGIIGLPYAVSEAGFFTGILLLVVLCAVTDWTIRLIVINAKLSGRHSYIGIMDHCFGASGKAAVSFFQFSFAFGGMCAFGIIIGDTIPHVIRSIFPSLSTTPVLSILTNRQFVIALCTICVSYPLSLYRDISKLSRASGFALVGMLIIVGSVLVEGPQVSPDLKGNPDARFSIIQPRVFEAIGVISFAFVCHHNSLLIYGSLKTPTLDRFAMVTHVSTILSLLACCTLAISAFLVFTDKTQGNILNNFSQSDTLINIARFCFGLNMFTTLPLELFVCREVIEQYFFSHEAFNMQRHVLFTTSILFSSMFISLITCDLGVMLEITGGVSATALAFIFPAACYLKLTPPETKWNSRAKLPAVACVTFGCVVLVLSLFLTLGKAWTSEGQAKVCM